MTTRQRKRIRFGSRRCVTQRLPFPSCLFYLRTCVLGILIFSTPVPELRYMSHRVLDSFPSSVFLLHSLLYDAANVSYLERKENLFICRLVILFLQLRECLLHWRVAKFRNFLSTFFPPLKFRSSHASAYFDVMQAWRITSAVGIELRLPTVGPVNFHSMLCDFNS
jgi:hypothetical protein